MFIIKITELKTKESGLHYYNKGYLMDWITKKNVIFRDQKGYDFIIDIDYLEFGSLESYVYKESGGIEPYHSGQCYQCYQHYQCVNSEIYNNNINIDKLFSSEKLRDIMSKYNSLYDYLEFEDNKLYDERFSSIKKEIWNENILHVKEYNTYYKSHPCNFCKYKGIAECIFIFDIVFSHKGEIKIAVEVNNTSPVKKNKIAFCKENDITLIQVNAKDVNRVTLRNIKIVPCEILSINKYSGGMKYLKDLSEHSTETICLNSVHDLFYKLYGINLSNNKTINYFIKGGE